MIHHSVGASRRVAGIVAAVLAVGVCSPASAGGGGALGAQPEMRGSYCGESDEAAPSRAGCARITGYIVAGERFGSGDRIGGARNPFAPVDDPGIAAPRSPSGLIIMGAPATADRFLVPLGSGDIAR